MPYTMLEHATDALIEVVAPDVPKAFEEAGLATTDIMLDRTKVARNHTRDISLEGESMHELLYLWLEEVVFQVVTCGFAISDIRVKYGPGHTIQGTLHGEPLSVEKHCFGIEVKAPTYHEMLIEQTGQTRMRFLLDL